VPANLTYYEVLGLDAPPKDRKAVKRAYSKNTRPEDDPEGFMRLRDAHDLALSIIAREAANAAWRAEQAIQTTSAEDVVPAQETEAATEPDTSYAIGPSPSLDAPLKSPDKDEVLELDTTYSIGATPNFNAFAVPANWTLMIMLILSIYYLKKSCSFTAIILPTIHCLTLLKR